MNKLEDGEIIDIFEQILDWLEGEPVPEELYFKMNAAIKQYRKQIS